MHKFILHCINIFLLTAVLTSCSHHIKNDLIVAVGHNINSHEAYYGKLDKIINNYSGTTRRYVNIQTECIYDT